MSNIIKLEKTAVIEYSAIDRIAEEVDKKLSQYNFDQLVVNEDSVKGIKKLRAELGKEYKEFEEARKTIKKKILETYDTFNGEYEAKIASKYKVADSKLKEAIDEVENGIKQEKEDEIRAYFDELAKEKLLDFLTFEQANIKVNLSDSIKSLKEKVEEFINNVDKDIDMIMLQKHDKRILVRYKQSLDVHEAISTVLREVEQEELLMKQEEEKQEVKEEIKEEIKPHIFEQEEVEEEKTVTFTATATVTKLRRLRQFMKDEGIKYD